MHTKPQKYKNLFNIKLNIIWKDVLTIICKITVTVKTDCFYMIWTTMTKFWRLLIIPLHVKTQITEHLFKNKVARNGFTLPGLRKTNDIEYNLVFLEWVCVRSYNSITGHQIKYRTFGLGYHQFSARAVRVKRLFFLSLYPELVMHARSRKQAGVIWNSL